MTHALHASRFQDIDTARGLAQAGAIAVNVALLMALMTPMAPPLPVFKEDETVLVLPTKPKPVEPPPVPVTQEKPKPMPVQMPTQKRERPQQTEQPPVVFEQGEATDTIAPPDVEPAQDGGLQQSLEPARVETGTALRYAVAPPPPYPRDALRDRATGTVLLEVLVDVDGRPLEVKISQSSGHRGLDNAARRHVLARWRFEPAMRDGRPVQAIGIVPVDFVLAD